MHRQSLLFSSRCRTAVYFVMYRTIRSGTRNNLVDYSICETQAAW